ncbi:BTB/POZ domain-containing protein At3g05675-like [Primulina huaijiensis]|uniref:BTB/POZ domain-containing protein At3g05675-like n=1 Tax=Primulina huaijiensis TaxID=1492673 RepID=UPI003CC6EB1C
MQTKKICLKFYEAWWLVSRSVMYGKAEVNLLKFDDQQTSDVSIQLRNKEGRQEFYCSHSLILKNKSKHFADRLLNKSSHACVEIECSEFDYDHCVRLLKLLYLPSDSVLDALDSVQSALGVLQVAETLRCEAIVNSCIQYLEAVPWEDIEEGEIVKVVSRLGPMAVPILPRIQPVDINASKGVLISAIRLATSTDHPFPPFGDELRISAQEQVDYMLRDDEDMPLVTADNEVKMEARIGLSNTFSLFERELSSVLKFDITCTVAESKIMQNLSDLEWVCNILPKMGLMDEFVFKWIDISDNVLLVVEDKKLENIMWGLKVKIIEVTSKVLDAVGYGNVILPAPRRVKLLKSWLPFIRNLKPILDSMIDKDMEFPYKLDEDTCQSIEGAVVSLVLALPSDDQADILADWMNTEHVTYPDLSEAFEVWSFRTKSAKRRLVSGLDRVDDAAVVL